MEVGERRAGDRTVGLFAVRLAVAPLLPAVLLLLSGCQFVNQLVAAGAGGAAAAATGNPVVGIAVGVGVNAGIDAALNYTARKWQQGEQDALADEVATMQPGERRPWKIEHFIPIGDEHGEVEVVRLITNPLTECKELVFSVQSGDGAAIRQDWYTTDACRDGERWKWSLAEPAAERWGALQGG
jgi:hypothetical protein